MNRLTFRSFERRARRMGDMMKSLNVDPLGLSLLRRGDAYADAQRTCLNCSHSDDCLLWLDGLKLERPTFCQNLPLFETFKR